MASVPFTPSDPIEEIRLESDGHWITATLTASGEMIMSDDNGELHRYRYCGRRGDTCAVIDSVEAMLADLIWQRGPIDQWIQED